MTDRETNRWTGVTALAFVAAAVGVLTRNPAALLVAAVGGVYAAYAAVGGPPDPSVRIERDLSAAEPDAGDEVTVTVTVHNEGGFLPDLRLVDDVPETLAVVDGSPRLATALRPGRHATFSYAVEAARGAHAFGEATVVARDLAGSWETERRAGPRTTLRCVPALPDLDRFPLRGQAAERVGRLAAGGGSGTEFHATREYRPGDPIARIDWNRHARTGDLATVEFREEKAAPVVAVVDAREEAYVADADGESAVERCVAAAGAVASARLETGDRVGVAAYGPEWTWVEPTVGREHRFRLEETLALADGFAPTPQGSRFLPTVYRRRLRRHLPADAQVVLCTPLVDDAPVRLARELEARGHPVTAVTPDPTGAGDGDGVGVALARAERRLRLHELRRTGVRVVDWAPDVPIPVAVRDAERGWRR